MRVHLPHPLPPHRQTDEIYAAARPDATTLAAWAAAAAAAPAAADAGAPARLPPPPPRAALCAMFSATLPSGVEALAQGVLRDPLRCEVGGGACDTHAAIASAPAPLCRAA